MINKPIFPQITLIHPFHDILSPKFVNKVNLRSTSQLVPTTYLFIYFPKNVLQLKKDENSRPKNVDVTKEFGIELGYFCMTFSR